MPSCRSSVFSAAIAGIVVVLLGGVIAGQPPSPSQLTLLSRDGRRALPTVTANGQEFVALDDLAAAFQLSVREEALGNITVSYKGKTIVLTPDQALASVAGRLVSLPAPPTRSGRRWLVPVEFVARALAPIYDTRLDLRKPAHLVVVGDLRVPRITVRYDPLGAVGRLTIDAVPHTPSTVSQDGDRVTIRFDADALDVAALLPPQPPTSLVQNVRLADAATMAVDLAPKTTVRAVSQPAETGTRLVIDLAGATTSDQAQPPQPAPAPAPAPPGGEAPAVPPGITPPQAGLRTVVIDPGHGGEDQGVRGAGGAKEKDLALAAARRLKAAVEGRLGIRVLLTRDDDRNVPLDDRTALANNNKADLFISIHANASFRSSTSGLLILTAAFAGDDAAAPPRRDGERLPAFGGGLRDVELVPWSEAQIRHVDRSTSFAKLLEQILRGRVPLAATPAEAAPVRVLESANMPAVLIEMGYLSNPEQEKQMTGGEFQAAFTQSLLDAIVRFRDGLTGAATQ